MIVAHERVSETWILLPLKQSIFCTVADSLHAGSLLCVWATGPFECDEWAVDIEQRGWAARPGRVDKASDCAKNAALSNLPLRLITQGNTHIKKVSVNNN